jgi:hypothetical protein
VLCVTLRPTTRGEGLLTVASPGLIEDAANTPPPGKTAASLRPFSLKLKGEEKQNVFNIDIVHYPKLI